MDLAAYFTKAAMHILPEAEPAKNSTTVMHDLDSYLLYKAEKPSTYQSAIAIAC